MGRRRDLCVAGLRPEKVFVAAAKTLRTIAIAAEHHISVGPATVDWPALLERKQGFVRGVPDSFENASKANGIDVIHGSARFTGPVAIAVGDDDYTFGKAVIATGSKARSLPIPGFEHTVDSNGLLDMDTLPASIVFIGGGVIALEMGHVYQRAGAQ